MKLVLEKFSKSFGPVSVIENLDLTVHSGEMLALLGPSGCGKSTTLFSICGIYRMNSGKLLFDQKDMSNVPSQQRNVGVVFQNYALYPHMSVEENLGFSLKIAKVKSEEIEKRVTEAVNILGLEGDETIIINDILGKEIFKRIGIEKINLSSFEKGTYFLTLSKGGQSNTFKVIKK